jgi:hypothetical protein
MKPCPLRDRFWTKVRKGASCWEWTGAVNAQGYGLVNDRNGGGCKLAHRVSYAWAHGDPGSLCVLHKCDNPRCVNPEHLLLGTRAENQRDMAAKGRASRGEEHCHAKLREDDVREIRRLVAAGHTQKGVAGRFGVQPNAISRIVNRRRWGHI